MLPVSRSTTGAGLPHTQSGSVATRLRRGEGLAVIAAAPHHQVDLVRVAAGVLCGPRRRPARCRRCHGESGNAVAEVAALSAGSRGVGCRVVAWDPDYATAPGAGNRRPPCGAARPCSLPRLFPQTITLQLPTAIQPVGWVDHSDGRLPRNQRSSCQCCAEILPQSVEFFEEHCAPAARSGSATRHGGRRFPKPAAAIALRAPPTGSAVPPYQSGVAVWGPMLTPAAARRTSVGASGAPSQLAAGGSAGNGTPSGRRNWNCPAAVSYHLKALFVHRTVVEPAAEDRFCSRVSPPSAQCTTWWASQWRESQPGNWHWLRSRFCRARRRAVGTAARPATDVEHLAIGAVRSATREASQARRRAASLPRCRPPALLDDRLTGVEVRCRRRRLAGACARLGRFRGNVRRGSGRLTGAGGSRLPARVRRGSDRLRGRRTGARVSAERCGGAMAGLA